MSSLLQLSLFFLSTSSSLLTFVSAGNVTHGGNCSTTDNRLQAGTYQFFTDCDSQNYCFGGNNTCLPKGCRKDDFPFGYTDPSTFPPKCPRGQFCPDEGDACQPWIPVGQPCQLNRDDQCEAPPNFAELADTTNKGLNFNGSVCLNNFCMWANVTEGNNCTVENTPYTAYGPNGTFLDIVSRGNCQIGFYCDSQALTCMANKLFGVTCGSDKECDSYNCLSSGTCGVSANTPRHFPTWVYAVVGIAILGGMFGTLFTLFFFHRRHRDKEREKRLQYWREQNAFHQNLLQMRDTARASLTSLSRRDRHNSAYSDDSHAPILSNAAPKAMGGGAQRFVSDDGQSELYDEGYNQMMGQAPQQFRNDGRF